MLMSFREQKELLLGYDLQFFANDEGGEKTEEPVADVQEQQGQDSEPEPGQEESKTVLLYFDEAKAAREEAEKHGSSAKKKQARRSEKN